MTSRLRRRLIGIVVAGMAVVLLPHLPAAVAGNDPAPSSVAADLGRFDVLGSFELDASKARVAPASYTALEADLAGLRTDLSAAPSEDAVAKGAAPLVVTLPDPTGKPVEFAISTVPVMEPELAAKYPQIRTYAGRQVGDGTRSIALDVTPTGFHAYVRSVGGPSWFIDPAYNGRGVTEHLSYYEDSLTTNEKPLNDEVLVSEAKKQLEIPDRGAEPKAGEAPGVGVTLRTYRLGLVTDPAYAEYFDDKNLATPASPLVTMAERATLVNRVNKVYNDDLAVRMVMANGSDRLNLDTDAEATGPKGPCGENACYTEAQIGTNLEEGGGCTSALITRTRFVIGQIIGADNYDIGHIALGGGSGGIAQLGVVGEANKARGCTGLPTPDGDFFAIDYVAHEMGHQYAGNHTFDGVNGSCAAGNRNADTSVEPGSGSSVMAYAGICFTDNLQPHSDPYMSQKSIEEMTGHVTKATPNYAEQQTVSLLNFDGVDSFTVSYPPTGESATFTRGSTYNQANIQAQMVEITNAAVTVTGYDGAASADDKGFKVTWPTATDNPPRLVLSNFLPTGMVSGFVGVDVQGGPATNRGILQTDSGNQAPSVTAPPDRTIPQRTPFALTAVGSDVDGDALVYLWEQNDPGPNATFGLSLEGQPLNMPDRPQGPLFRIFGNDAVVSEEEALEYESEGENLADGNPTRSFPDMAQILENNTNAETPCEPLPPADPTSQFPDPYLDCQSELLPSAAYQGFQGEMNFRVTVRDLDPAGGGTQYDDVKLEVGTAGPFLVTSRNTAGTPAQGGQTEAVTWDEAGTNSADYAENVKISLSTDGGANFTTLIASTPNDGTHDVTWPMVNTTTARVKVEAVDNYFFDVNNADFAIASATTPTSPPTTSPPPTGTPNTGPVARANASTQVVPIGGRVRLDARNSFDSQSPDSALRFTWDFGNRGRSVDATGPTAVAKYGKRGFRTITLTVTDPQGLRDTAQIPIQVLRRKDCEDASVSRTNGWGTAKKKSALGGRYCTTGADGAGERMRSAFSGDALTIFFGRAQTGGRAAVFVDERRVGTIRFQGTTRRPKFDQSATFKGFGRGGHFVRLVVLKGRAFVDTFSY